LDLRAVALGACTQPHAIPQTNSNAIPIRLTDGSSKSMNTRGISVANLIDCRVSGKRSFSDLDRAQVVFFSQFLGEQEVNVLVTQPDFFDRSAEFRHQMVNALLYHDFGSTRPRRD